jgi:hypothetical protein
MAVILATQEAEIRTTVVQSQPRQIVCETLSRKSPSQKKGGVAQDEGPEFKPQPHKKESEVIFLKIFLLKFHCLSSDI